MGLEYIARVYIFNKGFLAYFTVMFLGKETSTADESDFIEF